MCVCMYVHYNIIYIYICVCMCMCVCVWFWQIWFKTIQFNLAFHRQGHLSSRILFPALPQSAGGDVGGRWSVLRQFHPWQLWARWARCHAFGFLQMMIDLRNHQIWGMLQQISTDTRFWNKPHIRALWGHACHFCLNPYKYPQILTWSKMGSFPIRWCLGW